MADLDKLLSVARAEIGTKENPANSNKVKYNTWYYGKEVSGANYPWCSVFVAWCFDKAGLWQLAHGSLTAAKKAYVEGARQWKALAQAKGQWVASGYKPGDVVTFSWDKTGAINHVGIIEDTTIDGKTLITIEGNTSAGSDSNGGEVQRRKRVVDATVVGAFRPKYEGGKPLNTQANDSAVSPSAGIKAIVDRMIADGVAVDRTHWLGVFSGTIRPVPEYVKTVIERYQGLKSK